MRKGTLAAIVSVFVLGTGSVAARGGMPEPLTPAGKTIEGIYFQIFLAGLVVFFIVFALLAFIVVRYRAGSGHGRATFEKERHSMKAELVWIVIPLIVVLWVGFIAYAGLLDLDEGLQDENGLMEIGIVGSQWNWRAVYNGGLQAGGFEVSASPSLGIVSDENVFKVPADVPIRFNITSTDVIHAFNILDANDAPVGLVDANPSGPHKYNHLDRVLPKGEYLVQCKEMCLNPGHGYMRARIQAVSMDEFQEWSERKTLEHGAGLVTDLSIQLEPGTIKEVSNLTTVKGSRVILAIANNRTVDTQVNFQGLHEPVMVPAGQLLRVAFNVEEPGTYTLSAQGGGLAELTVLDAKVVDVELGEWTITTDTAVLQAGETYLMNIRNVGTVEHNLYIGSYDANGPSKEDWASQTIGPGGQTFLLVEPDEAMTFDAWCNLPGHADLGMLITLKAS